MNKKLLVISILAVFMLLAISFSTAVSSDTTSDENRESPLFRVRARRAIGDRLKELRENIKARFIGERIFWLPIPSLRQKSESFPNPETLLQTAGCWTCMLKCVIYNTMQYETCGIFCK